MIRWFLSFFEKNQVFSWLVTLIIAVMIFYISSLTFPAGGGTSYISYIYHFTAFSYLALFLLFSLAKGRSSNLIILGIIIAFLYGISDEIHQYFVPGRYPSFKDILINSLGILVTSIAYASYCIKNGRKR